jgi:hypothetical protein
MGKVNAGWIVVDERLPLLTYLYSFGRGLAHSLAVGGPEGLIVVSPPSGVPDAAFSELETHGKVRALVASNAFHHMGLPAWKRRFPDAELFAPRQSIERVEKQSKLANIRPLSAASAITGPDVELVDMPHYKTGEVLVRAKGSAGSIWYVTDCLMNMPRLPPGFPVNLVFKWSNSAPGFKLNGIAPLFMVKDKRAHRRWLKGEVDKAPPALVIPCHGEPVRDDPAGQLRALLAAY